MSQSIVYDIIYLHSIDIVARERWFEIQKLTELSKELHRCQWRQRSKARARIPYNWLASKYPCHLPCGNSLLQRQIRILCVCVSQNSKIRIFFPLNLCRNANENLFKCLRVSAKKRKIIIFYPKQVLPTEHASLEKRSTVVFLVLPILLHPFVRNTRSLVTRTTCAHTHTHTPVHSQL